MDLHAAITADCQTLAELLRQRRVPKARRRGARELLGRAFEVTQADTSDAESTAQLSRDLDRAIKAALRANPFEPKLVRVPMRNFVRIGAIRRQAFALRIAATWSRRGERLDEIVDWFWDRCEPDSAANKRPLTARDQALDQFGAEMEYVWGRRGKRQA